MAVRKWRFVFRLWHLLLLPLVVAIIVVFIVPTQPKLTFAFRELLHTDSEQGDGRVAVIEVTNSSRGALWTYGNEYQAGRQFIGETTRRTGYSVESPSWNYLRRGDKLLVHVGLIPGCDSLELGIFVDTGIWDSGSFMWSERIDLVER